MLAPLQTMRVKRRAIWRDTAKPTRSKLSTTNQPAIKQRIRVGASSVRRSKVQSPNGGFHVRSSHKRKAHSRSAPKASKGKRIMMQEPSVAKSLDAEPTFGVVTAIPKVMETRAALEVLNKSKPDEYNVHPAAQRDLSHKPLGCGTFQICKATAGWESWRQGVLRKLVGRNKTTA